MWAMSNDEATQALLADSTNSSCFQRREIEQSFNEAPATAAYVQNQSNVWKPLPLLDSIFTKDSFRFTYVLLLLALYLGTGTVCFYLNRNHIQGKKTNVIIDAIYFCIVTMTTVGYGDLVPSSTPGKLLACVYVFAGMALVGLILTRAVDYMVEKQEALLVKAIHMNEKLGPAEIGKEVEENMAKYKFFMTGVLLLMLVIVGTAFLMLVEHLGFVDAFYCVCSTVTTLGYGDKSFSTRLGRFFAIIWILSSTVCLAQFFLYLAEFYAEKKQRSLVKLVVSRKLTRSDLEAADLDHDKVVSVSEFILFRLKEMGKIGQDDVVLLMERFSTLDIDKSGTLTEADLLSPPST